MCGETRIPRDMYAGNTLPEETYITDTGLLPFFVDMSSRRSENMGIVYRNVDCKSFTPLVFLLIYLFIIITVSTSQAKTLHGGGVYAIYTID